MSAKIYYLRPFQREPLEEPVTAEPPKADDSEPAAPDAGAKRVARRSMPFGRNSKWKKKIGGGVVRRDGRPEDQGADSDD